MVFLYSTSCSFFLASAIPVQTELKPQMLMLEISPFSLDKKRVIPASWLEQIPQESLKHKNFPEHLFRKPLRLVDAHDVNSNLVGGLEHEFQFFPSYWEWNNHPN